MITDTNTQTCRSVHKEIVGSVKEALERQIKKDHEHCLVITTEFEETPVVLRGTDAGIQYEAWINVVDTTINKTISRKIFRMFDGLEDDTEEDTADPLVLKEIASDISRSMTSDMLRYYKLLDNSRGEVKVIYEGRRITFSWEDGGRKCTIM